MSDRVKPWRAKERKHWRKVEKRRKQGKVQRAPVPDITSDASEEPYRPTTTE